MLEMLDLLSVFVFITAFGLALLVFTMFILSYPSLKHAASLRNNIGGKNIDLHIPAGNHILRFIGLYIEKALNEASRFLSILKNDKVLSTLLFGIIILGIMIIGLVSILAMYLIY
jgi:hypothetical protein